VKPFTIPAYRRHPKPTTTTKPNPTTPITPPPTPPPPPPPHPPPPCRRLTLLAVAEAVLDADHRSAPESAERGRVRAVMSTRFEAYRKTPTADAKGRNSDCTIAEGVVEKTERAPEEGV